MSAPAHQGAAKAKGRSSVYKGHGADTKGRGGRKPQAGGKSPGDDLRKLGSPVLEFKLSEKDVLRAKEAFMEKDLDESGFLDVEEVTAILHGLGRTASVEKVKEMMAPYDQNGDSRIDMREFIQMLAIHSAELEGDRPHDERHTDALISMLLAGPQGAAGGADASANPEHESSRAQAHETLPHATVARLEAQLQSDFGLSVHIADHVSPPVTQAKLRQFLLSKFEDDA
eukprot:CAMPEP_0206044444 /NCGR_PEP_ID=MMETSP1466-20131121/12554_1 /ASSEMBLY_ACC=CAM_ASM_001126 /TAXON_ID=44452 /ORGANISM="Pavlova gyrans, Strain CCMP608" /LENGTH=227 /DNA_ID=CAMNT_0053419335 /DNA_START=27 /DNA_END=710 /DNA_ORIENTATION=-